MEDSRASSEPTSKQSAPESPPQPENNVHHQPVNARPPKLIGALALLQLHGRVDPPQESPAGMDAPAEIPREPVNDPSPIHQSAPPVPPPMPERLTIIESGPVPERFLIMKCPTCAADLDIYNQTSELDCGHCGAGIVVERKGCVIALRRAAELPPPPDTIAPAASATRDEELKKLRAEEIRLIGIKRSAGILGGLCGLGLGYVGIADIAARNTGMGITVLLCSCALLASIVAITRHTTRLRAQVTARIRAISAREEEK
jgi:ribosomal protein S27E